MEYLVRKAEIRDLGRISEIYAYAREFMSSHGNPNQWGNSHPPEAMLKQDIEHGELYVISSDEIIHGVFYFKIGEDLTYKEIWNGSWHSDSPYGVIHRIAGDGSGGILGAAVQFAGRYIDHLRIDTHQDNTIMQCALEKKGFHRCGIIHVEDGSERIAYDLLP